MYLWKIKEQTFTSLAVHITVPNFACFALKVTVLKSSIVGNEGPGLNCEEEQ